MTTIDPFNRVFRQSGDMNAMLSPLPTGIKTPKVTGELPGGLAGMLAQNLTFNQPPLGNGLGSFWASGGDVFRTGLPQGYQTEAARLAGGSPMPTTPSGWTPGPFEPPSMNFAMPTTPFTPFQHNAGGLSQLLNNVRSGSLWPSMTQSPGVAGVAGSMSTGSPQGDGMFRGTRTRLHWLPSSPRPNRGWY